MSDTEAPVTELICPTCGGAVHANHATLTPKGARAALERSWDDAAQLATELDSTYRHIRAVIENCKHSPAEVIRQQLVGLLPEVRGPSDELRERFPALAARQDEAVQAAWAEYGFGGSRD